MEHSSVTMIDLNTSFFSGKKGKVDTSNFINTTLSFNTPYSAAVITSSNFMNNTQNSWTLHVIAQQISLSNNTFLGNEGRDENGILFLYPQQRGLTVHNCTFVDNRVIAQNDQPESSTLTVKGDQLELVDNVFSCNSLTIGSAHNSHINYPPIFVEDLSDAALSSIKLHSNEILDCEIEVRTFASKKEPYYSLRNQQYEVTNSEVYYILSSVLMWVLIYHLGFCNAYRAYLALTLPTPRPQDAKTVHVRFLFTVKLCFTCQSLPTNHTLLLLLFHHNLWV